MKLLMALVLMVVSVSAYSGRCNECTIKYVGCSYTYQNKQTCNIVFNEPLDEATKPSCANNPDNRMAFDVTKDGGKAMLSVALSAKATNAKVLAYGTDTCNALSGWEEINLLYIM